MVVSSCELFSCVHVFISIPKVFYSSWIHSLPFHILCSMKGMCVQVFNSSYLDSLDRMAWPREQLSVQNSWTTSFERDFSVVRTVKGRRPQLVENIVLKYNSFHFPIIRTAGCSWVLSSLPCSPVARHCFLWFRPPNVLRISGYSRRHYSSEVCYVRNIMDSVLVVEQLSFKLMTVINSWSLGSLIN